MDAGIAIPSRPDLYFRLLIDNLPAGAYTCDAEGLITYYNRQAVEMWGRAPKLNDPVDRFCGSFKLFAADGTRLEHARCWMALALRDEKGYNGQEIIVERPDGRRLTVLAHANPIHDESGRLLGAINMLVDITERKQIEEQLRRSEQELADTFENAAVGIHWVGPDGIILRANRAELEMLGYTREEYVGRHIADFHADRDAVDDILRRLSAGEDLHDHDARLRCKDGSVRHVRISSNVRWENGEFIHTRCFTRDVTGRKEAAEARARLAAIVESSDDAIVSKNLDGIIQSWNRGAERIFGYTAQEAVGRSILLIIPPDRHDEEADILARLRRGERVDHFETVRRRKDGRLIDISVTISPIFDQDGRVMGASKVARDITEHKEAEIARARLAAIVDNSDDAIISKDLNGIIQSWNKGAEGLFGYTAEEAIGQPITLIVPPDRLDEEADILERLRRGERIQHFETVRRCKDGSMLDLSLSVSPIVDAQGQIVGASKIARDIAERKQAEQRLREQAHTLATINQVAATLSAELELDHLVQAVTDAGTELSRAEFGSFFYNVLNDKGESYTLYALSGAPREAFVNFPMPRNTQVFDPTFRGEGVVRSGDITKDPRYGKNPPYHGMPEGHLRVKSYLAAPVVSRSGEVLGGLFFGHSQPDMFSEQAEEVITALAGHAAIAIDNARLYEQARRLNETLEEKVEQRTADLKALNAELETFNYSVAHDLRGSLRGIDGYSQVTLEEFGEALGENGRHYLERVRRATQHMGDVIDNLLELSKLIRVPVVHRKVDLGELARAAAERLREAEPERQVTVDIQAELTAFGDRGLLRVALDNILGNAWKFTRDQARPRIEVGHLEQEGERVYFVRDNGAGFEMAYADKLFRPFQRLHAPGEYEGTGIGLATVQRIIRKHGGRIWAESEPGKGATFYFTLGR